MPVPWWIWRSTLAQLFSILHLCMGPPSNYWVRRCEDGAIRPWSLPRYGHPPGAKERPKSGRPSHFSITILTSIKFTILSIGSNILVYLNDCGTRDRFE